MRTIKLKKNTPKTRLKKIPVMILILLVSVSIMMTTGYVFNSTPQHTSENDTAGLVSDILHSNSISVSFPLTPTQAIKNTVLEYITQAICSYQENSSDSQNTSDFLNIDSESNQNHDIYSLKFDLCTYYEGEANPESRIETMNYDPITSEQYALSDFLQGDYLNSISKLIYEKLSVLEIYQNETELDILKEGVAPATENFENFIVTDTGFLFYFQQYEIGSRANPTDQVELSFQELSEHLVHDWKERLTVSDEEMDQPVETDLSKSDISAIDSGDKLVAITFDDGPHEALTPKLLDILEREEVPATFYLLGKRAAMYPEVVLNIHSSGHQIGSHTTNHKQLTKLSDKERKKELQDTDLVISGITGFAPSTLRPPYGAYNDKVITDANRPIIMWSVDPEDWKHRDADKVYHSVANNVKDGDIILLHDIHETSVQAADKIIPKLKAEGYTFVTVDQLIQLRGEGHNEAVHFSLPQ